MEQKTRAEIRGYVASGRERLVELAAFLEAVPADKLTFTRWYGEGKGCAVGLAAHEPWFKAQGLRLDRDPSTRHCWPVFEGRSDRVAVAGFFGLSLGQMRELLDSDGYAGNTEPHPRMVAGKIRSHLADSVES